MEAVAATETPTRMSIWEYDREYGGCLRHIAALEGLMRSANINIPDLDIPAYRPPSFGEDGEIVG